MSVLFNRTSADGDIGYAHASIVNFAQVKRDASQLAPSSFNLHVAPPNAHEPTKPRREVCRWRSIRKSISSVDVTVLLRRVLRSSDRAIERRTCISSHYNFYKVRKTLSPEQPEAGKAPPHVSTPPLRTPRCVGLHGPGRWRRLVPMPSQLPSPPRHPHTLSLLILNIVQDLSLH